MTDGITSPRVNSVRMSQFVGCTVRLPCKVLKFQESSAIVEACDGGQVTVRLSPSDALTELHAEIIGQVVDSSTLKFMLAIDLPDKDLDMKLINDVVELTFDPRFKKIFPWLSASSHMHVQM